MLVVPFVASIGQADKKEKKVLGAIMMQNKREFDGEVAEFNDEDIEVMETFAKYLFLQILYVRVYIFENFQSQGGN